MSSRLAEVGFRTINLKPHHPRKKERRHQAVARCVAGKDVRTFIGVQRYRSYGQGAPPHVNDHLRGVHDILVPGSSWPPPRGDNKAIVGPIVFDDLQHRLAWLTRHST